VVHVSSDPGFADFLVEQGLVYDADNRVYQKLVPWDFGPVSGNGDTVRVYLRAPRDTAYSATDTLALEVDFEPQLTVVQAPVVEPDVLIEVPIVGIERMRFAITPEALATAEWIVPEPAGSDSTTAEVGFSLSTDDDTPEIFAQYESDFGFDVMVTTVVPVAKVQPATLTIDGGAEFATDPERMVQVVSQAPDATLMRISESPDFSGVPWIAYADTVQVQLSATPGSKTLYGWYTNVYDPQGQAASDDIILLGESLR
jgi:hypothetical protein